MTASLAHPCDTPNHDEPAPATHCIRQPDERGITIAVNVCLDCRSAAKRAFPNLQIVPLYSVSRDLPATKGPAR